MKLTVAALLLAVPAVAGRRSHGKIHRGTKAVRPNKRMMRHAKHIGGHKIRHLEDNQNNNQNQQNDERDISWMYKYSISFDKCHSATTVRQEGQGDAEFGNLIANNAIEFSICNGSGQCGYYLAPMLDFLNAYTEAQMEEEEFECEMAREQCEYQYEMNQNQNGNNNNGNNNEQYYMNECYQAMGKDFCMEYEGQEEFEVQRFLECAEMEGGNDWVQYFVGPYCAENGSEVRLGVFQDGGCAVPSSGGLEAFSKMNYGRSLPYSSESLVSKSKTISCQQVDQDANQNYNYNNDNNQNNNNNQNWNQDIEINQFCEEIYELSAKCEKGLSHESSYYWTPDNEACSYMANVLPKMDAATFGSSSGGNAAKAFAWIFALTTLGLGGYVFYLHKNKDRKVDLSSQGDAAQA